MGGLSDLIDKVTPNEVKDFMNSAADKLMPKEIAPYMSIIAPMLTPYIGPMFAHSLAQLGSAKMTGGQLDPFAALAVHGAGATDTARGIRANYDPSVGAFAEGQGGTLGQRLSGAAGDFFSGERGAGIFDGLSGTSLGGTAGNTGNMFSRALQPTQSMFAGTSAAANPLFDGIDLNNDFRFMEREADMLKNMDANQLKDFADKYKQFDMSSIGSLDNAGLDKQLRTGMEEVAATSKSTGVIDQSKVDAWAAENNLTNPTSAEIDRAIQSGVDLTGTIDVAKINAMPSTNNPFDAATDGVMDFFMPELDESQQLLEGIAKGSGSDISKAFNAMSLEGQIATMSSMTGLTQAGALQKAMQDAEYKSKEERNAVYKEFFDSYEKFGQRKYNDPRYLRYKDPELVAIYNEIYGYRHGGRVKKNMGGVMQSPAAMLLGPNTRPYTPPRSIGMGGAMMPKLSERGTKQPFSGSMEERATMGGYNMGGRVNYNMGGIMQAPGVPENMELDYRNTGGFIPMGGPEKADDVPAMLSKNEFVLTADAMRGLDKMTGGSGDPRNAAKQMYQMMEQMEAMA